MKRHASVSRSLGFVGEPPENHEKLANMPTLCDGAYCRISERLRDACLLEFGKMRENLDIYNALEYLSEKGDLLYGKGTPETKIWFETMKWDLLNGGVNAVLHGCDCANRSSRSHNTKKRSRRWKNI